MNWLRSGNTEGFACAFEMMGDASVCTHIVLFKLLCHRILRLCLPASTCRLADLSNGRQEHP